MYLYRYILIPMKIICTTILCFCILSNIQAQPGTISSQRVIGADGDDRMTRLNPTADGGYIVSGYSGSDVSGDKSEGSIEGQEYWVMRLSSTGKIIWENTLQAPGSADYAYDIIETADGGYFVGGSSNGGIGGDKTQTNYALSRDYWVLRLDSLGNVLWDKTIGGSGTDYLYRVRQTPDGGFLLIGESDSPASYDKTEASIFGSWDMWIIKLDADGNMQWQNTIGGTGFEKARDALVTDAGTYLIGGYSDSPVSGDKTIAPIGGGEYWLVELNSTGSIIWQGLYGGNGSEVFSSMAPTADGGLILGGASSSGISGNKSEVSRGSNDYWIVKLDNTRNVQWDKTIGGAFSEGLASVIQTADLGYLLAGSSASPISGEKSEASIGLQDYWLVKVNSTGVLQWENTIGGWLDDNCVGALQANDGTYMVGGWSGSPISGDKTKPPVGPYAQPDFWLVKLNTDCTPGAEEICNLIDDDCDGMVDEGVVESINITANDPTTFCEGGSVELTASYLLGDVQWLKNGTEIVGATANSYLVTTKGTYTCRLTTDCSVVVSNEIEVHVYKKPAAFISAGGPTTFCAGGSVTLTANAGGGLSYQWYKGAAVIPGATNINYVVTSGGNYKCMVTKIATGCSKQSNAIAVAIVCRESIASDDAYIQVFPNPVSDFLQVDLSKLNSGNAIIELISDTGNTINRYQVTDSTLQLDMTNLPSGLYFLKVQCENMIYTERFVKM